MSGLITNRFFLATSALFLILSVGTIWFAYPPIMRQFSDDKTQLATLNQMIDESTSDASGVKDLVAQQTTINDLYDKSALALPTKLSPDILLLQLDGLTKDLGLNATITVPFSDASIASQVATPASPASDSDIKTGSGSAGSTQPIVTTTTGATNANFSLSGEWDYPTTMKLLNALKSFIRWNTVTSVDISTTSDKSSVTISGQVFWAPSTSEQFTGSAKSLIEKATGLFNQYRSYAVTPDVSKEGSFGKTNPFKP